MRSHPVLVALALACVPVAVQAQPVVTPHATAAADRLFDDSIVHDVSLSISSRDWELLKERAVIRGESCG